MPGQIFSIQKDGTLVEMAEQPFATEDVFQELLAKYPNLLAGDQIDGDSPRRWLLIKREIGIPCEEAGGERWSLDHLFLDQDAVPTLVEVKRSTDTRVRREVVGQMLDYAANAVVYWPVEEMRAKYEHTCQAEGVDPEQRLLRFLGDDGEPEKFWQQAKTNLQAKKIRLLFVADVIPPELRRIVEFLNEVTDPVEVLAVELKHFVGEGLKTLVPRVIGQVAAKPPGGSSGRNWDEKTFFEELTAQRGASEAEVARVILGWARRTHHSIRWGKGKAHGLALLWFECGGKSYRLASLSTDGLLEIGYGGVGYKIPTLNVETECADLEAKLATALGANAFEREAWGGFRLPFSAIQGQLEEVLDALGGATERVKAACAAMA